MESKSIARLNDALEMLWLEPGIKSGLSLSLQLLALIGVDMSEMATDDIMMTKFQLPNSERYDSWFQPHPYFKSDRACFEVLDHDSVPVQGKFYALTKRSRQVIAGSVHFTPNYEDDDFTRTDAFKIGIDFFLTPSGKSLLVVLSNRRNLRIVELERRLNNTQVEIFKTWEGASKISDRAAFHSVLWDSFRLKPVNEKFYVEVSNSFNEITQHLTKSDKAEENVKLFASRLLGRLLFCWFLRRKELINEQMDYFDAQGDQTVFYKSKLEPLFFRTLNVPIDERIPRSSDGNELFPVDDKTPYLNGGLFEPHENDWLGDEALTFPTGFFANLFAHFEEFNFTTDESSPEYEQVAIDPEMLGRVFESLLASQNDATGQQARKAKGAFYTPREVVAHMCSEALRTFMKSKLPSQKAQSAIDGLLDTPDSEWAKGGTNSRRDVVKEFRGTIVDLLDELSVIDPACGSGAFPIGMLQLLTKLYERLESRFDPYKTKLQIIENNIYGVDIEPMAVEIARLRAWLSLIVDEVAASTVKPLPNLDFKFVCANSLIPLEDNSQGSLLSDDNLHEKLKDIRTKYFNARKPESKKKLQTEYLQIIGQSSLMDDKRTRQLRSYNPFANAHPADFFDPDQMFGIEKGFDVVIANPPYVSYGLRGVGKLTSEEKELIKQLYPRSAEYKISLYALFMERAIRLCAEGGVQTFIVPDSFLVGRYFSKIRSFILETNSIVELLMLSASVFDATVGFSVVYIFSKSPASENHLLRASLPSVGSDLKERALKTFALPQAYYGQTKYNRFRLFFEKSTMDLINHIDNGSEELGNRLIGRTGVRSKVGQKALLAKEKIAETYQRGLISGGAITPFRIEYSGDWINIDPNLLNSGGWDFNVIHNPKILVRQTGDSLVAAVDKDSLYHLNNVHSFAPKEDADVLLLYVIGVLNSNLMNFYYQTVTMEKGRPMAQTDIETIESLPMRFDKPNLMKRVSDLVQEIQTLLLTDSIKALSEMNELNRLIYEIYDLSDDESAIIERYFEANSAISG